MVVQSILVALVVVSRFLVVSSQSSAITANSTAIRKVVTLIEEMKVQTEKEAAQDEAAWEKYMCWCKTNEEAKTEAIEKAERRVEDLTSLIEELVAKDSRLKTEIAGLSQDILDDQDALSTATSTREKEFSAFQAEEADLKETRGLLTEAIAVLSKVQLLQQSGHSTPADAKLTQSALIQLTNKIQQGRPEFQSIMKRDLFEVLGALQDEVPQHGFLPRKSAVFVEQMGSLLPWEKTEEQVGMEAKPNDLTGAAADSKSYNSRSGRILGLLSEMNDETARDLSEAQKDDFQAEVSFQHLRAAKLDEIAIGQQQRSRKEADLAHTRARAAEAREDKEATENARDADQVFLNNMLKDCEVEDTEYKKRHEIRSQELVALSETLRILSEDDARDLFGKTLSFLQVSGTRSGQRMMTQDKALDQAMRKIADVARKNKNWALVSLAVRVRLDAFAKVKEMMDKMLAELAKQQKDEYTKRGECQLNIDKTEDEIKVGENTREDLGIKHKSLVGTIEALQRDIAALKEEEHQMMVSLKEAGELRKEQDGLYQVSATDQRATTSILNRALSRLKQFYAENLLQQPGRAVEARPSKGKDYAKRGNAGAVIQLIMKIISDSEVAEQQFVQDEQRAIQLYEEFVSTTVSTIEADRAAIEEKSTRLAETESAKSDTEGEQLANQEVLAKLGELLNAHHLECDWLLKYYDIRQQARAEEMDAINDAKAILSGSSFGK